MAFFHFWAKKNENFGKKYNPFVKDHHKSPLVNAIDQGLLEQPLFTIYLANPWRSNEHQKQQSDGTFTFGAVDQQNCGHLLGWTPFVDDQFYVIKLEV